MSPINVTITDCGDPSWSPDGNSIACDDITGNIRIVDVLSGTYSTLTHCGFEQGTPCVRPAWSPDGRYIAYLRICGRGGGCPDSYADGLYLLLPDCTRGPGACAARLRGPFPTWSDYCSWAPDSRRIACIGPSGIDVIDIPSGARTAIAPNLCEGPIAWSPDGSQIACSVPYFSGEHPAIRIITLDGGVLDIPRPSLHPTIQFWVQLD
jgi:WD40 repeat protein